MDDDSARGVKRKLFYYDDYVQKNDQGFDSDDATVWNIRATHNVVMSDILSQLRQKK